MNILLLTLEAPLDPSATCTGNQVRADHLKRGLEHHGHRVTQLWRSDSAGAGTFGNAMALADQLHRRRFDAVLVAYWELAEWLPDGLGVPIVVDCVAPRPLEYHYEQPKETGDYLRRMLQVLNRADHILCGNQRQRRLMLGWLLHAGFDLRNTLPITVLPLSCDTSLLAAESSEDRPPPSEWLLVSGGRHWPWRQSARWLAALAQESANAPASIHCMVPPDQPLPDGVRRSPLMTYQNWREYLKQRAHIGVELADCNIEREFSQSFRAMACLEAGLPLLLNDYLELSEHVRRVGAGWCVATPEQAVSVVRSVVDSPQQWLEARDGACKLAADFDFRITVGPLAEWLERPAMPQRLKATPRPPAAAPASPGPWKRLRSLIAGGVARPFRKLVQGHGVVIVTRSDLFPADHGAAVKILETARALARLDRPVAIVTADRKQYWRVESDNIESRRLPAWLRWTAPPVILVHFFHLLRGWPESNAFLYWPLWDPFYALRAAWVGRRIGAAVYMAEFPAYARPCLWARRLNGGRVIMVEHNVEYHRIRDQVTELTERQFEQFKRWELALVRACDAVVCVSREDQRRLVADGADAERLLVIPHGVDVSTIADATPLDVQRTFDLDPELPILVYHGTYRYVPNAEAMRIMATEILPRLDRAGHAVQVLAIGSHPLPGLAHERIHFSGSLQCLGPALRAAQIAAIPLVQGGGTRMKILDYFAAGLPVVCTEKGCEGIPVKDGVELLIRNDWDDFTAAIIDLLEHEEQRTAIGQTARQFVDRLDWHAIGKRYDELIRVLCLNNE